MTMNEVKTCRLCLKSATLCKSHIYPEFMYKKCYDAKHSFVEFNANEATFNKVRRKGLYDRLLCRDCETIIKEYEDYAKVILYDIVKPLIRQKHAQFHLHEYNYAKFKLFILSLLWRASASRLSAFQTVKLGKYDEEIRLALFTGAVTAVDYFPCVIYQTHLHDSLSDGVFLEPCAKRATYDGKTIYYLIVDGLFVKIGVGCCSIRSFPDGPSVSPENLRIGYGSIDKLPDFCDVLARLMKQNKFDVYEKRS